MMRTLLITLIAFTTCVNAAPEKTEVPMTDNAWHRGEVGQFGQYLGRDSAILGGGVYAAKNTEMLNGRIEVDIAMHGQRGFVGIVFRHQSDTNYELVYLRPHKSGLPDALQYTPVLNGLSAWQLYSNEGFTAAAELNHNRWVHVMVIVEGNQARVFIDDRLEPALVVNDLKGGLGAGAVGIWGTNVAHFSNFSYTAAEDGDIQEASAATADVPANAITEWQISAVYERSGQSDTEVPADVIWQTVSVESGGLLNISRYRSKISNDARLDPASNKDLVFARTIVRSNGEAHRKLRFGYSDDVTVLLNGQPLYAGKSGFSHRYPGSLGILGLENDAIYLQLNPGDNELVFAVSEVFGGWGLAATLDR